VRPLPCRKIRSRAYTVTGEDLDALGDRYSEDQLFEIIIAAAFGAARERLAAGHTNGMRCAR
jgi:hypothetical protein